MMVLQLDERLFDYYTPNQALCAMLARASNYGKPSTCSRTYFIGSTIVRKEAAIAHRFSSPLRADLDGLKSPRSTFPICAFQKRGLVVTLRRSKTDQLGAGRTVAVPRLCTATLCRVDALRPRLEVAGICEGPIVRTFAMCGEL